MPREFLGNDRIAIQGFSVMVRRYRETLPSQPGGDPRAYDIVEMSDDQPFDNTPEITVPAGHVFVMGDSRDNSMDSRATGQVGFVPMARIVGRARFIIWSQSLDRIGTRLD